jgi:hypothetical protein
VSVWFRFRLVFTTPLPARVASLCCGSELGFELGDSVLEASAITDEAVHDGGVSLGGGVGGGHLQWVCEQCVYSRRRLVGSRVL